MTTATLTGVPLTRNTHPELMLRTIKALAAAGITTEEQVRDLRLSASNRVIAGLGQQGLNQLHQLEKRLLQGGPPPARSTPAAQPPPPPPPAEPTEDPRGELTDDEDLLVPAAPSPVADLTLAQRLELARRARPYLRRQEFDMGKYRSRGVSHVELMKKIKPVVLEYGIRWKIIAVELLQATHVEKGEKIWWSELYRYTFRFKRTEDPDPTPNGMVGDIEVEDVVVVARGLDDQDKGPGKSFTYAEKEALFSILNLERGDDPDLIPIDIGPDLPKEIEERIRRLRELAAADPKIEDPETYLRGLAAEWAKKYQRRAPNIYSLSAATLDGFIQALEKRVPQPPAPSAPAARPAVGAAWPVPATESALMPAVTVPVPEPKAPRTPPPIKGYTPPQPPAPPSLPDFNPDEIPF